MEAVILFGLWNGHVFTTYSKLSVPNCSNSAGSWHCSGDGVWPLPLLKSCLLTTKRDTVMQQQKTLCSWHVLVSNRFERVVPHAFQILLPSASAGLLSRFWSDPARQKAHWPTKVWEAMFTQKCGYTPASPITVGWQCRNITVMLWQQICKWVSQAVPYLCQYGGSWVLYFHWYNFIPTLV